MWPCSFQTSFLQAAGPPHPRELLLGKFIAKTNRDIQGAFVKYLPQARGNSEDE